jgi:hypothetical protein
MMMNHVVLRGRHRLVSARRGISIAKNNRTETGDARLWAHQNERLARYVLSKTPPILLDNPTTAHKDGRPAANTRSLDEYLRWRRWPLAGTPPFDTENQIMASKLLSHPLTYPLTLGNSIPALFFDDQSKETIRICCIGARAEASLPHDYWREMLIMASLSHSCRHWHIDFVGPDVPQNLPPQTIHLSFDTSAASHNEKDQDGDSSTHSSLTMRFFRAPTFHELVESPNNTLHMNDWDGFVLFNPGLGHANLEDGWKDTLDLLFFHAKKPLLLTAHSVLDAQRDTTVLLQKYVDSFDKTHLHYSTNPFASRMEYVDPLFHNSDSSIDHDDTDITTGKHVVSPNHSVLTIRFPPRET